MKNTLQSRISGTFCTCLVLAVMPSAFAVSMDGDITITGGAKFNKNLMRASSITSWTKALITSDSGGFSLFAPSGSAVTMAAWSFGSSTQSVLWTANGFTFDLTSSTILSRSKKSLTVSGEGTVSGNGFDATTGDWMFTFTKGRGRKHPGGFVFDFTATPSAGPITPPGSVPPPVGGPPPPVGGPPPVARVPDSGSTMLLLALGICCLLSPRFLFRCLRHF